MDCHKLCVPSADWQVKAKSCDTVCEDLQENQKCTVPFESHPSCAEVKNKWSCTSIPHKPSWCAQGQLYLTLAFTDHSMQVDIKGEDIFDIIVIWDQWQGKLRESSAFAVKCDTVAGLASYIHMYAHARTHMCVIYRTSTIQKNDKCF